MKNSIYILALLVLISFKSNAQTVTDIDGNVYNTVTIGSQTWMQENLKATHFSNGVVIPTTSSSVYNDTNALFQWAYNDDTSNVKTYGRLYTWNIAVSNNKVCPVGWKVPDNADWDTLTNFLGGTMVAGGKMKEVGTTHWLVSDSTVTNSSGFTALGSGFRGNPSGWSNLGGASYFWSTTPFGIIRNYPRGYGYWLQTANNSFVYSVAVGQNGRSIRCILDVASSVESYLLKNDVKLFPNPATDLLNIRLEQRGAFRLTIVDVLGNTLYEQNIENEINKLDIAFLPQGTYVIKLFSDQQIVSSKFIKR